MNSQKQNCQKWINCFVALGAGDIPTISQLSSIADKNIRFVDPFNDVRGYQEVVKIFEHTNSQLSELSFTVLEEIHSGTKAILKWEMTAKVKVIGTWKVVGLSELNFNAAGQVEEHIDYWDASTQFYAKLPVIGWLIRRIRAKAQIA